MLQVLFLLVAPNILMDGDSSSPDNCASLPPDICPRTDSSGTDTAASREVMWPGDNVPLCHEVPLSAPSKDCIHANDLVNSVCVDNEQQSRGDEASDGGVMAAVLPDLCGVSQGASSTAYCEPPENYDPPPRSPSALGAKPKTKVFKYKEKSISSRSVSNKENDFTIRNNSNSGSRENVSQRTMDCSHSNNSFSGSQSDLTTTDCMKDCSNSVESDDVSKIESALTNSSLEIDLVSDSKDAPKEVITSVESNDDNPQNTLEVSNSSVSCDEYKISDGVEVTSGNSSNDCDDSSIVVQALPPDEYLLYDSRPIGLVACGIWDCESQQPVAIGDGSEEKPMEGLMLVRNNLHSASHPMFSKWQCGAYIPPQYLVEVKFNSHGTSLGHATNPGLNIFGGIFDHGLDGSSRETDVKVAKRLGLIQHLPEGTVDAGTTIRECVICMLDLIEGERVRYLPCMHLYHSHCIDDWFQRSFTCPSCLEPIDAALLNTYNTT